MMLLTVDAQLTVLLLGRSNLPSWGVSQEDAQRENKHLPNRQRLETESIRGKALYRRPWQTPVQPSKLHDSNQVRLETSHVSVITS